MGCGITDENGDICGVTFTCGKCNTEDEISGLRMECSRMAKRVSLMQDAVAVGVEAMESFSDDQLDYDCRKARWDGAMRVMLQYRDMPMSDILALHDAEVEARVWLTASSMTREREKAAMRIANRQEKSDVTEWIDKRAKSESVAAMAHIAMELNFLRGEFEAKAKEAEEKAR